jgi:hypothetical protein
MKGKERKGKERSAYLDCDPSKNTTEEDVLIEMSFD